ncbi:carboxypeptidase-like regulatory domain-containing protein [Hymenobacter guriensis]|uniref:Carboxypeptidase-like regulatory domain-containing protein n=1 Tax=Hymenobacter guriensis TaxID=2793065 RepID=A0ABS0L3F2_9BACT|nr:carboxypeptidase-like regulatory domain-containing protein [Hymenobacter guriensis]MBG8553964.1 carboxypeptidase-like regulatory domain-containing protein [Hymenobacter guriensis]
MLSSLRRFILGLVLLLPIGSVAQQRLATARQQSYLTKVFRLTDAQTRHLYEHGLTAVQDAYFAQPVDSFPTSQPDSLSRARVAALPAGYYLVAHTEGPELVYWLHARTGRQLTVITNQQDLSVVVQDSLGQLLPDARLTLPRGRLVPFDASTQTYRLAGRTSRSGLLAVTQGGRTTFHVLEQQLPYRPAGRGRLSWRGAYQRVVFGVPLGLLTRPAQKLFRELHYASEVSTGPIGLLRSIFNSEVREERQDRRTERRGEKWRAYLVLSKPRYRPTADTLRLKARILHRAGRPYRRPLELYLQADQDRTPRRLALLQPVRPGTYEFELARLDTLQLRADQYVRLRLQQPGENGETLAETSFRLEDYELKNTRYTLRPAEATHRAGSPQALYLRGQDANELNLLDARVRLSVTPLSVGRFPGRRVFVPDTLWTRAQPLDAAGETRLNLPPTALPAANLRYQVHAEFRNADQERRTQTTQVEYALERGELQLLLRQDSVIARFPGGAPGPARLETTRRDPEKGLVSTTETVQLPLAWPVDARATGYQLTTADGRKTQLNLDEDNADLVLRSDRTADSLHLTVDNPRRLLFWYYLYRANDLVRREYTSTLNLHLAAPTPQVWYVSLHYFWGGELRTAEYNVALPQHQLSIEADQPEVVYPGQKVSLRYTVRDGAGRPVPGADLTAYAYTSKFEAASAPRLPDFEPTVVGRVARRRFALGARFENQADEPTRRPLPWGAWRQRLGLDSLRFYQFLYPAYGTFHEYQPAPGGITQVAPFVVDSGRVQPTVAVYVDGHPVYVAAVNGDEPFALVADSGYHIITVRTPTQRISLREVYLRPLHKLILSLDPNHPCRELTVETPGPLSEAEREELARFLVLIDRTSYQEQVLLRQGRRLQVLGAGRPYQPNRPYHYQYNQSELLHVGGPFRPDSVLLRRSDGLWRKFLHEPGYRYTFTRDLLKMRTVSEDRLPDLREAIRFPRLPFADFAYTEADLRPRPATSFYQGPQPEPLLPVPTSTPAGQGRLEVRLPASATRQYYSPRVLYTLLTQPAKPQFRRLHRQLPTPLHALAPGRYRLALLLADSTVLAPNAEVLVQANGTTYVQLDSLDKLTAGPARQRLLRMLGEEIRRNLPAPAKPGVLDSASARRQVVTTIPVKPQPDWQIVRGQVTDRRTGEGLPGVTVLLKGTTHGANTNADGSFALAVPPNGGILSFSSIGYVSVERRVDSQDMQVPLNVDTKLLSEAVVVAYGVENRQTLTGAVASVQMQSVVSGKASGLTVESVPGGGTRITLRGTRSVAGENQALIIVDGLPYTGKLDDLEPEDIAKMSVLKGESAVAMYGSRAANGVLIITTKNGLNGRPAAGMKDGPALGPDGLPVSGTRDPRLALRRRFSDVGWWRPTLVTDARGEARTQVIIPDDITGWDTFVLASDDHARTGTFTQRLRSFKALMGELAAPRFLLQGDRPQVIGKTLNYLPDTAQVTTSFQVGAGPVRTQQHRVTTAVLDTLTFTAPLDADSVAVRFSLAQPNGYQDGELRQLPVLPVGTRERVGSFAVLTAADTTLTFPARPELGPVTVRLESSPLPVVFEEIRHVLGYGYLCNEQAASKLQALLLEQRLREGLEQSFRGGRDVQQLIRHLLRGRHQPEGLWGTWPTSPVSPWATLHVMEALQQAEKQGYKVALDKDPLRRYLLTQLDEAFADAAVRQNLRESAPGAFFRSSDDRIRLLQLLHSLGAQPDFPALVQRLEREQHGRQPLDRYLALNNLRQQLGMPFQLDTLRRYRLRSELGGVFFADTLRPGTFYRHLLPDRLGNTLLAYRLLRARGGQEQELLRIRTYLLQQRSFGGHWASTYEAAHILATIGPELVVPASGGLLARAQLSGSLTQEVGQFPFETTVPATGPLTLRKQGGLPVYATAYQTFWNPVPATVATPFTVRTRLAGQEGSRIRLKAGQPTELEVTVDVPAEARYVLLEVPIPAGCSYGEKTTGNSFEVHREYLRNQVGIFIDVLPVGRHTFRIALQPRYRGRYTLNPAKAELMYFPTRFGRSASKQTQID